MGQHLTTPALIPFPEELDRRHGSGGIAFLNQPFRNALAEASRQHKFLLCYIHSEEHPNTNGFIVGVLRDPSLARYLSTHFVLWGADVRSPDGMKCLTQLGGTTFPFLCAVLRAAGRDQPVLKCQGRFTADVLLAALTTCVTENGAAFVASRADAEENAQRQMLRDMQAEELRVALHQDQERDRAERAIALAAETLAKEAALTLERIALARAVAVSRVCEEPPIGAPDVMTTRIFLLDGTSVERRFKTTDYVSSVADFVMMQERHSGDIGENFEIVTKAPPSVRLPRDAALGSLGLPQRAVLVVRAI